jgi:2-polyprenyl-6-methoxyphenol hydroxylase-like FAD-dependent oxidoreductase
MNDKSSRSIVVLGGGVAGLSAALAFARDGHRVTIVERDDLIVGEPLEALDWDRKGIPHFMQPHALCVWAHHRGRSSTTGPVARRAG